MIRLAWDTEAQRCDLVRDGGSIETTDSLETPTLSLLLRNRRARPEDIREPGECPRGYWGDQLGDGRQTGSAWWLRGRDVITQPSIIQAARDAEEAMAPLIRQGIAARVEAVGARTDTDTVCVTLKITRPDGTAYTTQWEGTLAAT